METYELLLDENTDTKGVYAISLVNDPAMESDFIALSKDVKMAVVDDEKKILMGVALIPDKLIPRMGKDGAFNVFFSKETVRKAALMFFKNGNQSESTLEHQIDLSNNTVFESWIKEDDVHDKSVKFGIEAPVGSWLITMKIADEEVYKMAKEGLINGFSIEGAFADMLVKSNEKKNEEEQLMKEIVELIENLTK
jgi:hypothetical protein